MPSPLYDITIPPYIRGLTVFSSLLSKAVAHGLSSSTILNARLTPDMLPFSFQARMLSDLASKVIVRAANQPALPLLGEETSIEELQQHIADVIGKLDGVPPEAFEGVEDKELTVQWFGDEHTLSFWDWALRVNVPQFYFHLSVAYGILRKEGVDVGKRDFVKF